MISNHHHSKKHKTQHDDRSAITNTTADLTQLNETERKDELAILIKGKP